MDFAVTWGQRKSDALATSFPLIWARSLRTLQGSQEGSVMLPEQAS